jgi:hypothetical protein
MIPIVRHWPMPCSQERGSVEYAIEMRKESEKEELTIDILAYLDEHPRAQDTLEGIVEWWLLERQIRQRMALIQSALDELVARQLVCRRETKDKRIIYRVNRAKSAAIRALLKGRTA